MRITTLLTASAAALAMGSTAFADGNEEATLNITGYVESHCDIHWENGESNLDVDINIFPDAGQDPDGNNVDNFPIEDMLSAGCNGPYSVSMMSDNGHLENNQDESWWFTYRVDFNDQDGGSQSIQAADAQGNWQEIFGVDSFDFQNENTTDMDLALDINFAESTASDGGKLEERNLVAGEYQDTLTFKVEADPAYGHTS